MSEPSTHDTPTERTESLYRKAAAERVVEAAGEGEGWLATAIHAELRMAWERGYHAGASAMDAHWTKAQAEFNAR